MSAVEFSCPHCSGLFQVEEQHFGAQVACPLCQGVVQLPSKDHDQNEVASPSAATRTSQPNGPLKSNAADSTAASSFAYPPGHPKASQASRPAGETPLPISPLGESEREPSASTNSEAETRPRDYSPVDLLPPTSSADSTGSAAGTDRGSDSIDAATTADQPPAPPPPATQRTSDGGATDSVEDDAGRDWMEPPKTTDKTTSPGKETKPAEASNPLPYLHPPLGDDKTTQPAPASDEVSRDATTSELLPPGADNPQKASEMPPSAHPASRKSVDELLPPGVDRDSSADLPALEPRERRASDEARPVVVPTEDGFLSLHDPVKTVKRGKQEREVVRLSREEKDHRRRFRGVVWWILSAVAIIATLIVLLKMGPIR